jgi:FAD/FMN-containing dehydrogenase
MTSPPGPIRDRARRPEGVPARRARVAGWGNYPAADCDLSGADRQEGVRRAIAAAAEAARAATPHHREPSGEGPGLIARGLGRAYGDSAVNGDGIVLEQRARRRFLAFDETTGALTLEAGASLADVIDAFLPRGWFPGTVPGTKFVTIGGAIAADVHGKNHHLDGSFGSFVDGFTLMLADGSTVACSRTSEPELFAATLGGMGLTGVILEATIRLRRVETGWYRVRTERATNLDDMLDRFDTGDDDFRYSVAWLDGIARGEGLGRGVLMRANDAALDELPPKARRRALDPPRRGTRTLPVHLPDWALNPLSMKAMNTGYYALARPGEAYVDFDRYFFPLDAVRHWNRGYGRRGFVQYQALLPTASERTGLREILGAIAASGRASFLSVLKRSGPAGEGMLSYLFPGATLALDLPNTGAPLRRLVARLDAMLLDHGGRLYLAKDALAGPETIRAMYPRLDEFLAVKRRVDPAGVFTSSQARRLGLDPLRPPAPGDAAA